MPLKISWVWDLGEAIWGKKKCLKSLLAVEVVVVMMEKSLEKYARRVLSTFLNSSLCLENT